MFLSELFYQIDTFVIQYIVFKAIVEKIQFTIFQTFHLNIFKLLSCIANLTTFYENIALF